VCRGIVFPDFDIHRRQASCGLQAASIFMAALVRRNFWWRRFLWITHKKNLSNLSLSLIRWHLPVFPCLWLFPQHLWIYQEF
jgi:hypothetical protein